MDKFKQLQSEGLIYRSGRCYKLKYGNDSIDLGENVDKSKEALQTLLDEGLKLPASDSVSDNLQGSDNPLPDKQNKTASVNTDKQNTQTSQEANDIGEIFENILKQVEDIDPNVGQGMDLDAYVSVDGKNFADSRDLDNPIVKMFPLILRWRTKSKNVDNGSGQTNQGYTVAKKSMFKAPGGLSLIKVQRDDSPQSDIWTVGNLVLCMTKKDAWIERQKRKLAKNLTKLPKIVDERETFAKEQALNDDVEQAKANYGQDAKKTEKEAAEIKEALAKFNPDNMSGDDALQEALRLDSNSGF